MTDQPFDQAHAAKALRSAEWTQKTRDGGQKERVFQWWLRFDPPALAWRTGGDRHVMDERGHLIASARRKTCLLFPHRSPWTAADVMGEVLLRNLPDAQEGAPAEGSDRE